MPRVNLLRAAKLWERMPRPEGGMYMGSPMPATPENFRSSFDRLVDSSPAHRATYDSVLKAFKKAKIPEKLKFELASPGQYQGRVFDLSNLGSHSSSYVQPFETPVPTRGMPQDFINSTAKALPRFIDDINIGGAAHGGDWYDPAPALSYFSNHEDPVVNAMGPLALRRMSAFSPNSSPTTEIPRGLEYHSQRMNNKLDIESLRGAHQDMMYPLHYEGAMRYDDFGHYAADRPLDTTRFNPKKNPKVFPYDEAKRGNQFAWPIDTHELAGFGSEYAVPGPPIKGALGMVGMELARRGNTTPGLIMPSHWVGFAPRNTLENAPGMLGRLLGTGNSKGMSSEQKEKALREMYRRPFVQMLDDAVADKAALVDEDPASYLDRIIKGEHGFAGGGPVRRSMNIAEYIRKRLPREYGDMPIKPIRGPSTGRKAFTVGENAVAKIVNLNRPRGFRENELEGDYYLADQGLVPRKIYGTDDNEITLMDRMTVDKPAARQLIVPMERAYYRNRLKYPVSQWKDLHTIDPEISDMMTKSDLSPFQNYNILAGDFFSPHHWMRNPEFNSMSLVDAGALEPGLISHYSSPRGLAEFVPQIGEAVQNRINFVKGNRADSAIKRKLDAIRERLQDQHALPFERDDALSAAENMASPSSNPEELIRQARMKMAGRPGESATAPAAFDPDKMGEGFAGGGVVRNWLHKMGKAKSGIDTVLDNTERYVAAHPPSKAWVQKNFTNYLKRQFGTPGDPLEKLFKEERLVKMMDPAEDARRSGFSGDYNEFINGNQYQNGIIRSIGNRGTPNDAAYPDKSQQLLDYLNKRLPGNKVSAEDIPAQFHEAIRGGPVHDIDSETWNEHMYDPTASMLDWLRTQPEETLSKINPADAYRKSIEWHEQLAKNIKSAGGSNPFTTPHKEYPTGYKWVKIDGGPLPDALPEGQSLKPSKNGTWVLSSKDGDTYLTSAKGMGPEDAMQQALKHNHKGNIRSACSAEGEAMGHCIGSYADDVINGTSMNYSLRDEKGRPHVTLEVKPWDRSISGDMLEKAGISNAAEKMAGDDLHGMLERDYPDAWEKWNVPSIAQIQGKQDRTPVAEYHPYIRDFVKSGDYGDVRGIKGMGLHSVGGKWRDEEEMLKHGRVPYGSRGMMPWSEYQLNDVSANAQNARRDFLNALKTGDESRGKHWDWVDDVPDDAQGFADGGAVPSQYDEHFARAEQRNQLPPGLLRSMGMAESNLNPNAVSKAGAVGLMQFMPKTAKGFGIDPRDPVASIGAAGQYMRMLTQRFGDLRGALAGYNWGEGNVATYGLDKMPNETRAYIGKVLMGFQQPKADPQQRQASAAPVQSAPQQQPNPLAPVLAQIDDEESQRQYEETMELLTSMINPGAVMEEPA